jgi:UDP-N-acetylmuramoyl-L-alanyl-D-glutamate--2,6-diaminopimelate ligase
MTDGHLYIADALERGAQAVAVTHAGAAVPGDASVVAFEPSPRNLALLAERFYGVPPCALVGITGTNGKTTTTYMIRHHLARAGRSVGLLGTIVYEYGDRSVPAARTTPDVCSLYRVLHEMANRGADAIVMEVSSHALAQERVGNLQFDVCAFTNLTRDHLDYHHTMDEYYAAKRLLFDRLRAGGPQQRAAIVCVDDEWGRRLAAGLRERGVNVLTVSSSGDAADIRATSLSVGFEGCSFDLEWLGAPAGAVKVNALGRHNVANWLVAAGVAHTFGSPVAELIAGAAELPPVPGRLEFLKTRSGYLVVVDYAHTDDALRNVLACLRELTEHELWVVFGCGGDRDKTKRPRMGAVAETLADHVIVTSDNPRTEDPGVILNDITAGMHKGQEDVIEDRRDAIRTACARARPGDVVLVAGKGHETYQEINHVFHAFDDREVTRSIIQELENERVQS